MRVIRAILSSPVEIICSLALIVVGVILTIQGSAPETKSTAYVLIGGIATALGGVLISWLAGKIVSRGQAMDDIRAQLDLVSRNLGQASGQISRAVEQAQTNDQHPATSFAVISQAAITIYAQVTAIQNILGDKFDSEDLLFTVKELESLAVQLEKKGSNDTDVGAVKSRLQEMRTELTRSTVTRTKARENTICPSCNIATIVEIGLNGGDTATSNCMNCGNKFNLHRRADGSLFTRLPGGGSRVPANTTTSTREPIEVEGNCPACGDTLNFKSNSGIDEKNQIRAVCSECGTKVIFDVSTRKAMQDGKMNKAKGEISDRFGSGGTGARPIVHCPTCQKNLRCVMRKSDKFYAIDGECNTLHEVNSNDFAAWRRENDATSLSADSASGTGEADKKFVFKSEMPDINS